GARRSGWRTGCSCSRTARSTRRRRRETRRRSVPITIQYAAQARQGGGGPGGEAGLAGAGGGGGPPGGRGARAAGAGRGGRRGQALRRLLLADDGTPQPALLLFLGDEQVRPDADHLVQPGDVLTVLPPIAGG